MILSMTGYGTGAAQKNGLVISVEIKTVNHRFLDLHSRLPREYLFLEGEIQPLVRKALDRGRVDITVAIQNTASSSFAVNSALIKDYVAAAEKLKQEFNFNDAIDLKMVLSLPGVLQNRETIQSEDAALASELTGLCITEALEGVRSMRKTEGEALKAEMFKMLASIGASAQQIFALSANAVEEHMGKIRERISQLLPQIGIDPQRLAQEAALLADKCDISEEIARLKSHIEQFSAFMDGQEKAGKKLDFLLQEMQREANTILSKSGALEISRNALSIKADIEKLREQVQNVE
jgi:uncharacterized protein (TIGR00255 family)